MGQLYKNHAPSRVLSWRASFSLHVFAALFTCALFTSAKANAAQLTLRWQDSSTNEAGFQIVRKTGLQGTFTLIKTVGMNTTSYVDRNVATGTIYCYRVRAFNAAGISPYSNQACGTARLPNCGVSGQVVRTYDSATTMVAYLRTSSLSSVYYITSTSDMNLKEALRACKVKGKQCLIVGSATSCPTTGTARNMGSTISVYQNP